jgi:hypothetical protein
VKAILSSDDSRLISGSLLKDALQKSLSMLGQESAQAVLEYLARSGIILDREDSEYSIDQLRKRFNKLFGEDAAELFDDLLLKALETPLYRLALQQCYKS